MIKLISLFSFILLCGTAHAAAPNLAEVGGTTYQQQFGYNVNAGGGDDVWYYDNTYPFTVSNSSVIATASTANDTSTGLGCKTIFVEGIDGDYNFVSETVTLAGVTSVVLTNSYRRINNAYCATTGSLHTNNGDIMLGVAPLNSSVLAVIAQSVGRAQQAIYTAPADKQSFLEGWGFSVRNTTAAVALQVRELSSAWTTVGVLNAGENSGYVHKAFSSWVRIPRKADLRLRVLSTGVTARVDGGLEIIRK